MAENKKPLIVANWKMNLNVHEASLFLHKLDGLVKTRRAAEVVLAPTMLAIQTLSVQLNHKKFKLAAQNLYWRDHGAFTGEVSATQLRGIVQYAIIGHSERRHVFHERERDIRNKVQAALRNDIKPILCIGETAGERADGETTEVLHDQLTSGLANVTAEDLAHVVIAYEPVWAIGTGDNATPHDVVVAERSIRRHLEHLYGKQAAGQVRLLYGGSVKPDSAAAYLAIDGIDGLLVGGASLEAQGFTQIIDAAHQQQTGIKK